MARLTLALVAASCLLPVTRAEAPARTLPLLVGVAAHPLWDGADARAELRRAGAAGARLVRVDVGWATLQPQARGRWSAWALRRLDRVVRLAERRRLRPLLTVFGTPCWAAAAPARLRDGCRGRWWRRGVTAYPPRRAGDYARAVAFLVRRYGSRVEAWEIWNEPNQRAFFATDRPATAYAGLLGAAYARVKRADPRAVVLGGAIAEADERFAAALYAAGARFDALSVHPYVGDRGGDAVTDLLGAVRAVMRRHGDHRPMWLTELGWSTSTRRDGPGWARGVDEATQARRLTDVFARLRARSDVRAAVWYSLTDAGDDPAEPADNYGLLRADGSPKPSLTAFRAEAAR